MSAAVSYSADLVDAAKQYALNRNRCTLEQIELLRRRAPDRNYYKASAEILLNLLEGAKVHDNPREDLRADRPATATA